MVRMREKVVLFYRLFSVFFRIGPSTFGGGYAMIPIMEKEIIVKRGWLTPEEMGNAISIAGSAPGGVGINAAAFIGYRVAGMPGAVAAVAGMTMPTFIIVCLLSLFYSLFAHQAKLAAALKGIHGAVIALIFIAVFKMAKTALFDRTTKLVAAAALGLLSFTSVNQLAVIIGGIGIGMIAVAVKEKLGIRARTEKESPPRQAQALVYPEYYI
ncbi:chromate transporter [Paenibacillus sacheonensis]|uniref:Chromate transporter n=1 Tax=Paenibacillus sacheonensis TaxID=742054 RepID=A0A7X4YUK1_9BACL|nr:chromate transporter [Paenibacillus sacheonensis]MBM7568157.1 chromate transporter [Paenibacillus sacheonensis]NBC71841.1 chromate transporter [Paenibacillus sacheonensis]